jgi:hypothetical protein
MGVSDVDHPSAHVVNGRAFRPQRSNCPSSVLTYEGETLRRRVRAPTRLPIYFPSPAALPSLRSHAMAHPMSTSVGHSLSVSRPFPVSETAACHVEQPSAYLCRPHPEPADALTRAIPFLGLRAIQAYRPFRLGPDLRLPPCAPHTRVDSVASPAQRGRCCSACLGRICLPPYPIAISPLTLQVGRRADHILSRPLTDPHPRRGIFISRRSRDRFADH